MDTPPEIKDAVIPTFRCPADAEAGVYGFGGGGPFRSGGSGFQGNYVGCAGDDFISINRTERGDSFLVKLSGIFYGNSQTSADSIRDGLSNTLLLSEVRIRRVKGGGWGDAGGYWGGGQHSSFGFSIRDTPNSTVADRVFECKTTGDPKAPCVSVGDSFEKINHARSYHMGGVNAALADGSTHFFSDTIDLAGCGPGGPKTVPVAGGVSFAKQPVAEGEIVFRSADAATASGEWWAPCGGLAEKYTGV